MINKTFQRKLMIFSLSFCFTFDLPWVLKELSHVRSEGSGETAGAHLNLLYQPMQ